MNYTTILSEDRTLWQINAIEKIKQKLLLYSSNSKSSHIVKEKLVVVYSEQPQVGKTTLILYLIGIKSDFINSVNKTLRGGITAGKSSTSTALFYKKSDTNNWKVTIGKETNEFKNDKSVIECIKKVRESVENNSLDLQAICIHIPAKYFCDDLDKEISLSILDMPGNNSKNEKERMHLSALYGKYLSISTVNIIVLNLNNINSLRHINYPNEDGANWYKKPSSYMVVATAAYDQKNIKSEIPKCEDFYTKVKNISKAELTRIFPDCKVEIFPIELADYFDSLLNEFPEYEKRLINAQQKALIEIRESIKKRNPKNLKSLLQNLHETILINRQKLEKEYNFEIQSINEEIKQLEESIENKRKESDFLKQKISQFQKKELSFKPFSFPENIKEEIDAFSGKHKELIDIIGKWFQELQNAANRKILDLDDDIEINLPDYTECIIELKAFINTKKFIRHAHTVDECKSEILKDLQEYFKKINKLVLKTLKKQIKTENKKIEEEKKECCSLQKARTNKLSKERSNLKKKKVELNNCLENIKLLEEREKHDLAELNDYIKTAKSCFNNQIKQLKSKLKQKISPEEKFMILLFIKILKDDYDKIIIQGE